MDEIATRQNFYVVMANTIITDMCCKLSLQHVKVLRYMVAKIQPTDAPNKVYTMSVKEYCETAGITYSGKNLNDIKELLTKKVEEIDLQFEWIRVGKRNLRIRWFDLLAYNSETATVEYTWSGSIQPLLFNLIHGGTGYVQYRLQEGMVFGSEYAFKLFELMKVYIGQKKSTVVIEIAELKKLFNAEHIQRVNDFARRVLDTAIEELRKYTTINVTYTLQKVKSRSYTHIMFTIREEEDFLGATEEARMRKINGLSNPFEEAKKRKTGVHGKGCKNGGGVVE